MCPRTPSPPARATTRDGPRVVDRAPDGPPRCRRPPRDHRRWSGAGRPPGRAKRAGPAGTANRARAARGAQGSRAADGRAPRLGAGREETSGTDPEAEGEKVAMGQKTHPIGFRIGVTRSWSSRWFATKNYANLLHEDVKIRRFIKDQLYHAGIAKIDIERSANRARITISTA